MEPIEKKSGIFLKPSLQYRNHHHHHNNAQYQNQSQQQSPHSPPSSHEKKKQKIIKWDEITIAEHDKERGSR